MQNSHSTPTRLGRQTRLTLALALGLGVSGAMATTPTPDLPDYLGKVTQLTRAVLSGAVEHPVPLALAAPSVHVTQTMAANTWQVTSCGDSGPGTLRDIVANWAQSGDTVDLSGLDCNIDLQSSIVTSAGDLTLKGNPETKYSIRGGNTVEPLVHLGAGTLTLDGLGVSFGRFEIAGSTAASVANGGCIYSTGNVKLTNQASVKYCTAENTGSGMAQGGGIFANGTVTLDKSSVSSSKAIAASGNALGGGIFANGQVRMQGGLVSGNEAWSKTFAASAGGIHAGGGLSTKYAMVSNNTARASGTASFATSSGGGAAIRNGASSMIKYSTFDNNQADSGAAMVIGSGGVSPTSGNTTIIHSTIANNASLATTTNSGGALTLMQKTTIHNSTISGNTEQNAADQKYGAGIMIRDGVDLTLKSTIVSGNALVKSTGSTTADDIFGSGSGTPTVAGDHNLIGMNWNADVPADTIASGEPKLGPLQDNGGYTLTMAVLPGSPAIDAGSGTFSTDQRGTGFLRSVGAAPDIGAFEMAGDRIFANDFETTP
ncbi:MAG TPA: right-handed parallel beta-helix repeat-containing protein [Rhodanobacteraceae bacterium]|nr:right-handed parallel beta-helix repeat-containing protein [Rhodanobacteraceae bacterium]